MHRGPKGGESLEDHFDALRFGLPRAPALAHRLDRDTSGCLVLGRHRKALAQLGLLFKSGTIEKTYWAVVEGAPASDEGTIELPLGRLDETRGWWMKPDPKGQPAVTKWKVLGRDARDNRPGSRSNRSPAAPISCACIARKWAGRSSAMRFTARRRAAAGRFCICTPARSSCRFTRTAQPIRVVGAGAAAHAGALCHSADGKE